jgi:hypothetical protein
MAGSLGPAGAVAAQEDLAGFVRTARSSILSDLPPGQPDFEGRCLVASTRYESSVIAVSWIPSEAIEGLSKVPFELGVTHYDQTPPDHLDDLEELRRTDRFREANELRAFIEV